MLDEFTAEISSQSYFNHKTYQREQKKCVEILLFDGALGTTFWNVRTRVYTIKYVREECKVNQCAETWEEKRKKNYHQNKIAKTKQRQKKTTEGKRKKYLHRKVKQEKVFLVAKQDCFGHIHIYIHSERKKIIGKTFTCTHWIAVWEKVCYLVFCVIFGWVFRGTFCDCYEYS